MPTLVVTGANRGLGLELTRKFSQEGWLVFACCKNEKNFPEKELSRNVKVKELDVANDKSHQVFVKWLNSKIKSIDVLINNAGLYDNASDGAPVFENIDKITPVFQVNAIAPRLLSDKLVGLLDKGNFKSVITISSYMGSHKHMDEFDAKHWPYSSSKAATNYAMDAFGFLNPSLKSIIINPGWMKTRLGGNEAQFEPAEIATKIYQLIINLQHIDSRKLYDINFGTYGKSMGW